MTQLTILNNMNKIKSYLIIGGMFIIFFFVSDYFNKKRENRILDLNQKFYHQELQGLKNNYAEYQFNNKEDLKSYLETTQSSFKNLSDKLDKQGIKIKNIRSMVSTVIDTKDTIINIVKLDSIYERLLAGKNFTVPIEYKSGCFFIKAELHFEDGTSIFRSLEESYNDTITYVTSDYRKPHRWLFGIKTTLFSRKLYKITLLNSCGDPVTIQVGGPANRKKSGKIINNSKQSKQ